MESLIQSLDYNRFAFPVCYWFTVFIQEGSVPSLILFLGKGLKVDLSAFLRWASRGSESTKIKKFLAILDQLWYPLRILATFWSWLLSDTNVPPWSCRYCHWRWPRLYDESTSLTNIYRVRSDTNWEWMRYIETHRALHESDKTV